MHYLSLFSQVGAAGREFGQVDWHLLAMTLSADTGMSAARRAAPRLAGARSRRGAAMSGGRDPRPSRLAAPRSRCGDRPDRHTAAPRLAGARHSRPAVSWTAPEGR